LQARHVWSPEAGASVLRAEARVPERSSLQDAGVLHSALQNIEHILVDGDGRQHVVLRRNGTSLQLLIDGPEITDQSVEITFLVQGLGAIQETREHLATLRRIISPQSPRSALPRWTATARKLHAALVALDGRTAGASRRDVAVVLYGLHYVKRNWETGLKRRMRHHLRRGLELSRGGFRNLLR
jgi:hypothetical protein